VILTTEKDAVRLRALKPEGIWVLRIELSVVEREEWEAFLLNSL
jgi:tetraacyldisaccharide-1-P 4'-kinase